MSVKNGADFLVAGASGAPAVTVWRYGLGRVVSITAYASDGGLGGLLSRPDSLLVSKSVNWAIGDPERAEEGTVEIPDTRVGTSTPALYRGTSPPAAPDVSFVRVGTGVYRATFVPEEPGVRSLLGAEYAVNYPVEYAGFGPSSSLAAAVETTGGRTFAPDGGAAIASFARRQSRGLREVRTEWAWALYVAALVLFLVEVGARRARTYRGTRATHP